ncbi:Cyclic di-GMP phosphodiesterase YfgF [Marinomonas spartinae]|uniref:Cyclic di-GMP phosphodiesterase YfgF n=1 Tax=Marinomonas spartinae TaxID=1792290 RepID=A0A1A8TUD1_9GAMM|nr:EAL domain-containing protein [Marinomonas spartinae]SBS37510.1 Cyclic di-GMP phosphodiesterase YfgF [Marinomonas spartinae]SBS38838.1 Cyclic di-GMP phosphodiesterase YfgF [Marinomonas spartinae]
MKKMSTVLIVDDVPENLRVLSDVIASEECQVMVANSGERALELLERNKPSLVLLDVMMGGIDGFETCRQIRANPMLVDLPVIFVTALVDDITKGFAAGGNDYITKPIRVDEVRTRVEHQLERFYLLQQLKELNNTLEERVRERTHDLNAVNRSLQKEVSERRYMQDRLNYLAQHDFVTKLYNRDALEEHVTHLISGVQHKSNVSVPYFLLIDINEFRLINDACGCVAGDSLLFQVAQIINHVADPKKYYCARLTGDKFAIAVGRSSAQDIEAFFEQLNTEIENFVFSWDGRNFTTSITQIAIPITLDMVTFDQVIMIADEVSYASKQSGSHQRVVVDESELALDERRSNLNWGLTIIDGLEKNLFEVHFQQVFSLDDDNDDKKKRIEILVRLRDDKTGTLIYPNDFIRSAERFGIVSKIDRWVIQHTMMQLSERPELWNSIDQVALNVSALSVREPNFAPFILENLQKYQLDGSKFCFEITETEALNNFTETRYFMSLLHESGCTIALDDFGTGFSSFSYLTDLPFDVIKIDGEFVRDMHVNSIHHGMVDSIVKLAKLLNKPVVAEFIEHQEIVVALRELGVEWGQGYHFHRPEKL